MCIVLLAAAFFYAHIDKTTHIYDNSIDSSLYRNTGIMTDWQIEQVFTCEENVLDGVRIKCGVTGDVSGVTLKYTLTDDKTETIVADGVLDAAKIKNSKFNNFNFEQIKNTKNDKFRLEVEAVGAVADNGVNFFTLDRTKGNTELYIDGEKNDGVLALKTISKRFDLETFIIVLCFALFITVFIKFLYKLFK